MNFKQMREEQEKEKHLIIKEKFHESSQQTRIEYENSLLKAYLMEYAEVFDKLKQEQNDFLQQQELKLENEREQNKQSVINWQENFEKKLNELNNSVSNLKSSNKLLTVSIESTIEGLRGRIQTECSQEIRVALKENTSLLNTYISNYDKTVNSLINNTNETMLDVNEKMQKHLYEFDSKKKQFFMFDGIKNFFFWASQVVSFGTLGLLIYFLFVKG